MIKTAVIIAGGEGSRLLPLTRDLPKAMAPVCGKPMLHWVICWLKANGITDLVIGVAYKKDKIVDFLKSQDHFGLNVRFSEHTLEGGTAQAFHLAITRHVKDATFLGMNCDEITNLNVGRLLQRHEALKPLVTMALAPFHCRFSVVETENDRITGFRYGRVLKDAPVSIGVYILERRIVDDMPSTGSIEDAVFTRLGAERQMAAYMLDRDEQWISVNDIKNIKEAEDCIRQWGWV
ncbi:MAG: nucleotidyltransferase family protein [Lentisphaerae bacterium]|nr:nucleotidyltransferase family protein [Lentisphaerota bacterium]